MTNLRPLVVVDDEGLYKSHIIHVGKRSRWYLQDNPPYDNGRGDYWELLCHCEPFLVDDISWDEATLRVNRQGHIWSFCRRCLMTEAAWDDEILHPYAAKLRGGRAPDRLRRARKA